MRKSYLRWAHHGDTPLWAFDPYETVIWGNDASSLGKSCIRDRCDVLESIEGRNTDWYDPYRLRICRCNRYQKQKYWWCEARQWIFSRSHHQCLRWIRKTSDSSITRPLYNHQRIPAHSRRCSSFCNIYRGSSLWTKCVFSLDPHAKFSECKNAFHRTRMT